MDIYKYAVQHGFRFPSARGDLTAEQLFELPLKDDRHGFSLNDVAKTINAELKRSGEESFVDETPNPTNRRARIALDIVKDVIATKQVEAAAFLARAHRKAERQKILDIIDAKRDEKLSRASIKELERQLDALDDGEVPESVE